MKLLYFPTELIVTDILTKPLIDDFCFVREYIQGIGNEINIKKT